MFVSNEISVTFLVSAEKELCLQIFLKISRMEFYENLSGKSRVFAFGETDGRTDMTKVRPLPSSAVRTNLFNFGRFFCPIPSSE